jgi:hypothetical protein
MSAESERDAGLDVELARELQVGHVGGQIPEFIGVPKREGLFRPIREMVLDRAGKRKPVENTLPA